MDIDTTNSSWNIKLYELDMSNNFIEEVDKFTFQGLESLNILSLCNVYSVMPYSLPSFDIDLPNLQSLDLSQDMVKSLKINTPSLKHFYYGDNGRGEAKAYSAEGAFRNATSLEEIYFGLVKFVR